ncbi:MAG: glycosyltransferase family 2 protein [Methylacidiphilales bacterium]|nr:glycosyltransferase family 2 protein [Candidatus Methylacidiphilales bacterium]
MPEPEIDLTLFVACYNEEENIAGTLDTAIAACIEAGISFEIVIIDDASRDRSVEVINHYIQKHPDISIILKVQSQNEGLGYNYAEAAFLGHGKWYRLVCGKNGEPADTLATIFRQLGKADIIIPYHPAGTAGRTWRRRFLSWAFTALVNTISGHKLHYYNGLPVIRRDQVMRWHSNSRGFGFQADLLTKLLDRGTSYLEVPVRAAERKGGKSNALTNRNFLSVAHTLLTIFIRRVAKTLYGRN